MSLFGSDRYGGIHIPGTNVILAKSGGGRSGFSKGGGFAGGGGGGGGGGSSYTYGAKSRPGGTTNKNSGTTNRTAATTSYVDPYAAWGGQDAYNALLDGFHKQKDTIYSTARDAANNFGIGYGTNILEFINGLKSGQDTINSKGARNELAKTQGTQGVLGMVGRGIKSGGVMLANKNAGDSSAAGALANAYGDIGRRELSDVGNQYANANEDLRLQQDAFNQQRDLGVRKLNDSKTITINQIVADARDKFAQLDAAMADKSLPERIAIDQEKEAVRQQTLAALQQYDQQLQTGLSGIHETNIDERRTEANRLGSAGTDLGKDAFSYTTETPVELQGTGPLPSELPVFSTQKKKIA